jgi:hypothetical protein
MLTAQLKTRSAMKATSVKLFATALLLLGACASTPSSDASQDAGSACPEQLPSQGEPCHTDAACVYPGLKHIECKNPCPFGCKGGPGGVLLSLQARCQSGAWEIRQLFDSGSACPVDVTCVCQAGRTASTAAVDASQDSGQ